MDGGVLPAVLFAIQGGKAYHSRKAWRIKAYFWYSWKQRTAISAVEGGESVAFQIIALVAVVSTAAFLFLWFRDVRRIMRERKSTVESAKAQLTIFRDKAQKARDDPDAAAVLARSESIYRQAVEQYNRTLGKLWVRLPATLMGFRMIQNGGDSP